jgi:predicted acetyltransferase
MKRVVPRAKILLLPEKKLHQRNEQISRTYSKEPLRVSAAHQLLWYLLISCLLAHQLLQLGRLHTTKKRILRTLNQQVKETPKWNTPLISSTAQVLEK